MHRIDRDHTRYKELLYNRINLRALIASEDIMQQQLTDILPIPVHIINTPHFEYTTKGGVGYGDYEIGTTAPHPDTHTNFTLLSLTLEDIINLYCKKHSLHLPQPITGPGAKNPTYHAMQTKGPRARTSFRHSYTQALKRHILEGTYQPGQPLTIYPPDMRYRGVTNTNHQTKTLLVFMRDTGGTVNNQERGIIRQISKLIELIHCRNNNPCTTIYIGHDTTAHVLDSDQFNNLETHGSTSPATAINHCTKLLTTIYPPTHYTPYPFYFSDGRTKPQHDNQDMAAITALLKQTAFFSYAEVFDGGRFLAVLEKQFTKHPHVHCADITKKEEIYDKLPYILGKKII